MADKNYDILIDIRARIEAIDQAVNQVQRLHQEATGLAKVFEFAGGIEAVHRLTEALSEIPRALAEGIQEGIRFQAEIQDLQTNIAGILRLTQSDQFGSFAAAKAAAGDYIEVIKEAANKVGLAYHDMFEVVHETQSQLAAAGITDINETIQVSLLLAQAMQAVGVGAQNAARDVGDLLQGNLQTQGGRRLAAAIGLTTEELQTELKASLQAGTFLDFITGKFAALQDAIHDASQNFGADLNRMRNFITDLESEAAKPIMAPLQSGIEQTIDPKKTEGLLAIAQAIGVIASAAVVAANEVGKFSKQILLAAQFFPGFGPVIANATDLVQQLSKQGGSSAAAQGPGSTNSQVQNTQKVVELTKEQLALVDKINQQNDLLEARRLGEVQKVAEILGQAAYDKIIADARKLGPLNQQIVEAAERARREEELRVYAQQQNKSATEGERDARREITDLLREDSALLRNLQSQQRLIEENPFLGADDKQALLHANAIDQQRQLQVQIDATQAALQRAYGAGSQQDITQLGERLGDLQTRFTELGYTISTTTFTGQFGAELVQWVNSFGDAAHAAAQIVTGTLTTAIGGASQALTGLIFGTNNWRQAFAQAAQSIVQNIIQIVLQYVIGQAVMFVIRQAFGSQEEQQSNKRAASAAAKWAPGAIAASIASYGEAAGAGLLAFLGAEAVGTAVAVGLSAGGGGGGYLSGGYTGDGGVSEIAGIVHAGEYVLNARAVENLGVGNLDKFHARAISGLNNLTFARAPSFYQDGGYVAGAGALPIGSGPIGPIIPQINVLNFFELSALRNYILDHPDAAHYVINHVNKAYRG